jgi:DNA-binding MarR family transcriptional regulator
MDDPYYTLETLCPRISLGYLMKRVQRLARPQFEAAFGDGEFTFTQWIAMGLLHSGVADTASGIARDIGHDTGAMTRVIDQLAQRGLVERHPDPSDRRVVKLAMTGDGEAALMRLTPRVIDIWNIVLEDFPRADVDRFVDMLGAMEKKLIAMESARGAGVNA